MTAITLSIILMLLVGIGLLESYYHQISLNNLPIRIHVNGSRGKSSVTRLIAAGLRAGGLKTIAKTTGTAPRIIDQKGIDRIIHRLRSASIGEQVRLLRNFSKQKPDAIVIECMAVNPQYQWIAEQKMIKSTISVMTNVRPDHLDEMGYSIYENAMSLSNTIPFNGDFVTILENNEIDKGNLDCDITNLFSKISKIRKTNFHQAVSSKISNEYMSRFSYIEHRDNVALALKVCELSGIDKDIALDGMLKTIPDPGATVVWNLNCNGTKNYFINLLAANDPSSTYNIYNQLYNYIGNSPICIFLNTREDRRYRTNQLLSLIFNKIKPNGLIIRGDNLPSVYFEYVKNNTDITTCIIPNKVEVTDLITEFSNYKDHYILGIGNMVGWGQQFINELKEYRI